MNFRLAACLLGCVILDARAHELITPESVQTYLARVSELQRSISSGEGGEARGRASLQLGQTLDEIGELLNRDLASHGKVQGLASTVLMSELRTAGAPLAYSAAANRFQSNVSYYRDALGVLRPGPAAAEASFRLLQGNFYDSAGADPLKPTLDRTRLLEQIRLGERLRHDYPRLPQREEATFILAIHSMQAGVAAADAAERGKYAGTARALVAEFNRDYSQSIRAPTLESLLETAGLKSP